jgi:hypothetical protein
MQKNIFLVMQFFFEKLVLNFSFEENPVHKFQTGSKTTNNQRKIYSTTLGAIVHISEIIILYKKKILFPISFIHFDNYI